MAKSLSGLLRFLRFLVQLVASRQEKKNTQRSAMWRLLRKHKTIADEYRFIQTKDLVLLIWNAVMCIVGMQQGIEGQILFLIVNVFEQKQASLT